MFRTAKTFAAVAVAALAFGASASTATAGTASSGQQQCSITPYVGTYMGTASDGSKIHFSVDHRGDVRDLTIAGTERLNQGYALYGCLSTSQNGWDFTGTWSSKTAMEGSYSFWRNGHKITRTFTANAYAF